VLGLRVLFACELKEGGSRDQAAVAVGKVPCARSKVEDRRTPRTCRREGKGHRDQLDLVACGSHHRRRVVDPDVVGLREVEFSLAARNREVQSLHRFAVLGPRFDDRLNQMRAGQIEPTFAEFDFARFLYVHEIAFRLVKPTGTQGEDYDVEIEYADGRQSRYEFAPSHQMPLGWIDSLSRSGMRGTFCSWNRRILPWVHEGQ
jgi:hypothetical protein